MRNLKDCNYCTNLMALIQAHGDSHHEDVGHNIHTIEELIAAVRVNALDIIRQKASKELEEVKSKEDA